MNKSRWPYVLEKFQISISECLYNYAVFDPETNILSCQVMAKTVILSPAYVKRFT